jgi:hypothetical protein
VKALLVATQAGLGHGVGYNVIIVIGLVLWLIAIISLLSRWRR